MKFFLKLLHPVNQNLRKVSILKLPVQLYKSGEINPEELEIGMIVHNDLSTTY